MTLGVRVNPLIGGVLAIAAMSCSLIADAATSSERTYTNPVLFADYSDPDVIRVADDYFLVASSFHFSPGLPILKSKALVHCTIIAHALPRLDFDPKYNMPGPIEFSEATERLRFNPGVGHRYSAGVWAPA